MQYTHPVYTAESVGAQAATPRAERRHRRVRRRVPRVGLPRRRLPRRRARRGVPRGDLVTPASLYRTRIRHGRIERIRHGFEYRHVMWLVDVDDLPTLRRAVCARSSASTPATTSAIPTPASAPTSTRSWPSRVPTARGGRVLLLTNPRSFGYTFNPLSVFWCYEPDGELRGDHRRGAQHLRRASLLLRAARRAAARPQVDKAFYVSPFFDVDGRYDMRFGEPR